MLKIKPDHKFYSLYALRQEQEKLKKSKEPIIISTDTFWATSSKILEGINYELFKPSNNWERAKDFSESFKYDYKDILAALECNDTKYIDEIIFVGKPWEVEIANKYFGDGMLEIV